MLHGKIVRSPHAHARIVSIDTSLAERLPGVVAIATALDTPPIPLTSGFCDKYLFPADHIARFDGDEVAALAAESEDIAEEAASLIRVRYEELPALFDLDKSVEKDPTVIIHPCWPSIMLAPRRPGTKCCAIRKGPMLTGIFGFGKAM